MLMMVLILIPSQWLLGRICLNDGATRIRQETWFHRTRIQEGGLLRMGAVVLKTALREWAGPKRWSYPCHSTDILSLGQCQLEGWPRPH